MKRRAYPGGDVVVIPTDEAASSRFGRELRCPSYLKDYR